uniref:Interleukin-18-binding protein n=1 Tax=Catagonus wagneri TaxID=51154 RepID=A0A8C3VJN5_9CETA
MRMWVQSLASLSGSGIPCCCGCGVGRRCGSDPALLWLWCRPAAAAPIGPLAREPPMCRRCRPRKTKVQNSLGLQQMVFLTPLPNLMPLPASVALFPAPHPEHRSAGPETQLLAITLALCLPRVPVLVFLPLQHGSDPDIEHLHAPPHPPGGTFPPCCQRSGSRAVLSLSESLLPRLGRTSVGWLPRAPQMQLNRAVELQNGDSEKEGSSLEQNWSWQWREFCPLVTRGGSGHRYIEPGTPAPDTHIMTRRQILTPAPSPLWALLFCAHIVFHVARGTPAPQATVAPRASARMAKDPCSPEPPALPRPKQCPALEVTWPAEEVPLNGAVTLSCTACSRFPHFSILYWLGNGSFIEHLPGQPREGSTRRERRGARTQLHRTLLLQQLSPALRHTNFSCVFSDPGQTVQRHLVLAQLWAGLKTSVSSTRDALPSSRSPLCHHPDR